MTEATQTPLTTAQVAEQLGCTAQTVINHVKAGRLVPVGKLPTPTGTYLFDASTVEAFKARSVASA